MKNGRTFVILFLLIIISCFSFASCGSVSKEELNKTAAGIYSGANSALTELDEEGVSVVGNYVISSNPNYNYYNGTSGIENNTYDLYQKISSYCSDSDDYEYIFEVTSGWTGVNVSQVYVAEKWDSKTIGGYPTKSDSSEWPPYCMYLTNDFDTLQDIADSSGKLNAYNESEYNFMDGTYGLDAKTGGSLFDLSSFDYYGLLDEIIEACGNGAFKIFFIILIVSLIWCLFGYQVFQIFAALASLLIMTIAGLLAAVGTGSLGVFGICFVIGIILAIICAKSKGFSAFMLGVMNTFPITTIIALLLTQSLKGGLIIGFAIAAVIGIITAVIKKPLIILSSAIGFGSVAGTALACMIPKTKLSIVFQIIFICLGIFVQTKVSHGLLESGSLIAYIKGKHNNGDCNTESIEELPREGTLPKKKSHKKIKPLVRKEAKKAVPKCPSCGATLDDDSVFCIKCGNRIGETSITAPITKAPNETLKPKVDSVTKVLTEKLTSAPADTEPHEAMTETVADVIEAPKLSLGGLERKDSEEKTDGSLVINVDKNTEKKPIGNSHFTSADDFDD